MKVIIVKEQSLMHFFYQLSKLAGKYSKEKVTQYEVEKCKKDNIVIDGDECVTNALDFFAFSYKVKNER